MPWSEFDDDEAEYQDRLYLRKRRTSEDNDTHSFPRKGEWQALDEMMGALSHFMYDLSWESVGAITLSNSDTYEIIKHKDFPSFLIGNIQPVADLGKRDSCAGRKEFAILFSIFCNNVENTIGYPILSYIKSVGLHPEFKNAGITKIVYKWLFEERSMTFLGVPELSWWTKCRWNALSEESDMVFDIIDYAEGAVRLIERAVVRNRGHNDHDFDQRIMQLDSDNANIRLILRDVIL